jgi:hypothetical protein
MTGSDHTAELSDTRSECCRSCGAGWVGGHVSRVRGEQAVCRTHVSRSPLPHGRVAIWAGVCGPRLPCSSRDTEFGRNAAIM